LTLYCVGTRSWKHFGRQGALAAEQREPVATGAHITARGRGCSSELLARSIALAQGGSERRTHGSSWDGPNTHATRAGPPSPFGWWLQATVVGAGTPNTHVDRRTHAHSARILIGGNGAAVRWRRRITAAVVGAGTRAPRSRPHGARVLALGSGWRMHGACWCACARP
jgi:hypothetical protein